MFVLTHPNERVALLILAPDPSVEASVYVSYSDERFSQLVRFKNQHQLTTAGVMVSVLDGPPDKGAARKLNRFAIHNRSALDITYRLFFRSEDMVEMSYMQRVIPPRSTATYADESGWQILPETSAIVLSAPIQKTTAADTTIVAGVAGRKIRVLYYTMSANATCFLRWKSGASTFLTGQMRAYGSPNGAPLSSAYASAPDEGFILETAPGEALVLNSDTATIVGGLVVYHFEP